MTFRHNFLYMLNLFVLSLEVHHTFCQVKPPSVYEFPSKFVCEKENKTCDSIGVMKNYILVRRISKGPNTLGYYCWNSYVCFISVYYAAHKIMVSQQSFIICKSICDCQKALLNGHVDRLYLDTTATFISLNSFATFSKTIFAILSICTLWQERCKGD